jgi:hypothetical protein
MDFEKDLLEQLRDEPYNGELRPECILVDKVFDSCFQRECEPSKVISLTGTGPFKDLNVVYGPGFIVDGTLRITPLENNMAKVKFCFKVPFTVTVKDGACGSSPHIITLNDFVEFCKEIEVFLPEAASEFSFRIVIDTRSETLRSEIVDKQVILSIGVFVVIKVVGKVQLLVQAFGYCPVIHECVEVTPEDVCESFEEKPLPDFFPPQLEDMDFDL